MIDFVCVEKCFTIAGTRRLVLRDVTFSLRQGKMYALVGQSGAGKSTILTLAAQLDLPTSGSILIDKSLDSLEVGYVFQAPLLVAELTVRENVMLKAWGAMGKFDAPEQQADELLEKVACLHLASLSPQRLSGGEQRRVSVARALFGEPRLLLLDEPTAHLDDISATLVRSLIVSFCRSAGITALVSTHDQELVNAADEVFCLRDGVLTSGEGKSVWRGA
ncbi:MAG: ATP-binding cassette domain-containing protein [Candidatus Babeliaceae bacterium]|nr:ATP-binding cassette domain-containing protein [Candidatus Babeliaceae bacterium]